MRLAAITLILMLAKGAGAATPAACASLCGEWRLDAGASDSPGNVLDAAFLQFKEPRARRPSRVYDNNIEALGKAADEEALGPILDRPHGAELREELKHALRQPRELRIGGDADDIRIAGDNASQLSISPGENHTRVDAWGTARITARWRGPQLAVSEKYDRRNQQETTFSVGGDGTLQVQQVLKRQGLPRVTVRSVYRRP